MSVAGPMTMGLAPILIEQRHERADNARVRDVADDADACSPSMPSEALANCERVEQRLGGVLVLAVAAVDDVGIDMAGEQARRALLLAAHDDEVGSSWRRASRPCRRASRPLSCELDEAEKLMTSADMRLPAISKLVRVRVDGSRKRLMTVRPRSVGSFLMVRSLTSLKLLRRVREFRRSPLTEYSSMSIRCL